MFKVWVEYYDSEDVKYYVVSKNAWFDYLHNALEKDDTVEHYVVEVVD